MNPPPADTRNRSIVQVPERFNGSKPRGAVKRSERQGGEACEEFLLATRYCDVGHPTVRAAVTSILGSREPKPRVASIAFRFVRDEIAYTFGPWGVPASHTLSALAGTCTNKSNLLVALLRAAGIPAAYGVLLVNAREYFGVVAPHFLTHLPSSRSIHVYAAAYLGNRWIKCDPSTDSELAAKTAHFCPQTRLIEWTGTRDAVDFLDPSHVYEDLGLFASIDDRLDKPPRSAQPETMFRLGNDYLRFIRSQPAFASAKALIDAYRGTLEAEAPD